MYRWSTALFLLLSGFIVPAAYGATQPVVTFYCSNGGIMGSGTETCTVWLKAAAPSGGESVSLSSNNAAAQVPSTVTVPAGSPSAQFTATYTAVTTTQTAVLSASAGGATLTYTEQLLQATTGILVSTTNIAFPGYVAVNSTATMPITVYSTGTMPLIINAATTTGAGFWIKGTTFPLTVNPAQTVTLEAAFSPTAAGNVSGQIFSPATLRPVASMLLL